MGANVLSVAKFPIVGKTDEIQGLRAITANVEAAIAIQGSIVTKPWSYFDFNNNSTIKGDGQVLFQQQLPIFKEGGSASFSYNFDLCRLRSDSACKASACSVPMNLLGRAGGRDFAGRIFR